MVHLGRFWEMEYQYNASVWAIARNLNKAIDIGEWSVCGGGRVEKLYCIYNTYSETSLNRPTMGPTLYGSFREVVELKYHYG